MSQDCTVALPWGKEYSTLMGSALLSYYGIALGSIHTTHKSGSYHSHLGMLLTNWAPVLTGSCVVQTACTAELPIQYGGGVVALRGPHLGPVPTAVGTLAPGAPLPWTTRG